MGILSWFGRAFRLISTERTKAAEWIKDRWALPPSVSEVLIRQKITGGEVEVSTPEEEAPELFIQRKAYIVWYSGNNYEVRREIAIEFWLKSSDRADGDTIRGWLDRACQSALAMGTSLNEVEGWHGARYDVTEALTGIVKESISDYTYTLINWFYTKESRPLRNGMFPK